VIRDAMQLGQFVTFRPGDGSRFGSPNWYNSRPGAPGEWR
jgi:hypothetical protein